MFNYLIQYDSSFHNSPINLPVRSVHQTFA